jgi:putative RNA 2'-phosphotransferase
MAKRKEPKQLLKLMTYVLGHQPDEFGLGPDQEGFFRVKDVIKAICEEPGWGYVRRSHINEVLITWRDHPFVMQDNRIRVENARDSVRPVSGIVPPKLLYHCVRRKGYPVVCREGILPTAHHRIFLAATQELALRMGKRRDPKPVLLTVLAEKASEGGVPFYRQGSLLYWADHIPPGLFSGPALPKQKEADVQQKKEPITPPLSPGSFVLDMERSDALHRQKIKIKGVKKDVPWKKDARNLRRERKR